MVNFRIKLDPELIPASYKSCFFELTQKPKEPTENGEWEYAGWVSIKEDGTIEFGEPGG